MAKTPKHSRIRKIKESDLFEKKIFSRTINQANLLIEKLKSIDYYLRSNIANAEKLKKTMRIDA